MQKLKLLFLDTSLFRLLYILCLFFCMVMYTDEIAYVIIVGLFVWGFLLSVYSVVKRKAYANVCFGVWLLLFMLSFTVTIFVNINSDVQTFLFNVFMLLHASVCFFVFFGMHTERGVPFRWELYLMARIIVYLSTIFSLIGLCLMLFTAGSFDNYMYYEGVFKGFYTNPNYQGYVSAISIIFCHMLTKPSFTANSGQKRVSRIWLVCCVVLNCVALLLCDSNASLLLIVAYGAFILLMKLFSLTDNLTPRKMITRTVALGVAGIIAVAIMFFVRVACRLGVAAFFSDDTELDKQMINELLSKAVFIPKNDTGFTSRWFLWEAGAKIFVDHPIFGIGKGNLYDCIIAVTGRENFNSGFEGYALISFTDLHNGYFTVLVTAGIVGFVLFMIFLFRCISMVLPVWYVQRKIMNYSVYPCLLAFLGAYFLYAFVEKTLLFDVTFLVMSFWLILGYTVCYALDFGYFRRGSVSLGKLKIDKRLI
ncbi:MAG: O-antigen ligase family protein [Ruminococcus sp.]